MRLSILILCSGVLACARPVAERGACDGAPGLRVTFPDGVTNASFVGDSLYFDNSGVGVISRVPLAGGAIEVLVDGGATGEWAAGGGTFAWDSEPVEATAQSSTYVDELHISDSSGATQDFPPTTNDAPQGMKTDALGNVYWLQSAADGMFRWDHASKKVTELAGARYGQLDEAHVFWLASDGKTIEAMPTSGGEAATLATLELPSDTAASLGGQDADRLYAVETPTTGNRLGGFRASRIVAINKATGASWTVADGVDPSWANLASDGRDLYWATVPAGTGDYISEVDLVRAPIAGGGPVVLLERLSKQVVAIGVDDCSFYAVTRDGLSAYLKP